MDGAEDDPLSAVLSARPTSVEARDGQPSTPGKQAPFTAAAPHTQTRPVSNPFGDSLQPHTMDSVRLTTPKSEPKPETKPEMKVKAQPKDPSLDDHEYHITLVFVPIMGSSTKPREGKRAPPYEKLFDERRDSTEENRITTVQEEDDDTSPLVDFDSVYLFLCRGSTFIAKFSMVPPLESVFELETDEHTCKRSFYALPRTHSVGGFLTKNEYEALWTFCDVHNNLSYNMLTDVYTSSNTVQQACSFLSGLFVSCFAAQSSPSVYHRLAAAPPNDSLAGLVPCLRRLLNPPHQVEHLYYYDGPGRTPTKGHKFSSSYQTHIFTSLAYLSQFMSKEDYYIHYQLGTPDLKTLYLMVKKYQKDCLNTSPKKEDV